MQQFCLRRGEEAFAETKSEGTSSLVFAQAGCSQAYYFSALQGLALPTNTSLQGSGFASLDLCIHGELPEGEQGVVLWFLSKDEIAYGKFLRFVWPELGSLHPVQHRKQHSQVPISQKTDDLLPRSRWIYALGRRYVDQLPTTRSSTSITTTSQAEAESQRQGRRQARQKRSWWSWTTRTGSAHSCAAASTTFAEQSACTVDDNDASSSGQHECPRFRGRAATHRSRTEVPNLDWTSEQKYWPVACRHRDCGARGKEERQAGQQETAAFSSDSFGQGTNEDGQSHQCQEQPHGQLASFPCSLSDQMEGACRSFPKAGKRLSGGDRQSQGGVSRGQERSCLEGSGRSRRDLGRGDREGGDIQSGGCSHSRRLAAHVQQPIQAIRTSRTRSSRSRGAPKQATPQEPHGRRHHGGRSRSAILAFLKIYTSCPAAFSQAWSVTTIECRDRWATSANSDVVLINWNHSAVHQPWFKTTWEASESALGLHFELNPVPFDVPHQHCLGLAMPKRRAVLNLAVHFAEVVEVTVESPCDFHWQHHFLPHRDVRQCLESYEVAVVDPNRSVGCISCASLPSLQLMNEPIPPTSHGPQQGTSTALTPTDSPRFDGGDPTPTWFPDIWELLGIFGEIELEEEGPIMYVNSHYIHHQRHPHNRAARPLRFDRDWGNWEESVRFMWEDLVDASPINLHLVTPNPPVTVYQGTVATVIVTQGPPAGNVVCLMSAIMDNPPITHVLESAHSTNALMTTTDIIDCAGVTLQCEHRLANGHGACEVHVGHQQHPLDVDVNIYDGLSITIAVPPVVPQEPGEEDDDTSLLGHFGRSMQAPASVATMRDLAQQSGDDFAEASDDDESSSETSEDDASTSSDNSQGEWKITVLVDEEGNWPPLRVPWDNSRRILGVVSQHTHIPEDRIEYLHHVQSPPVDLADLQFEVLLVEKVPITLKNEYLRYVLVDVEIYGTTSFSWPSFSRTARWFFHCVNRQSVLRLLGFDQACSPEPLRCLVWHKNEILELAD